MHSVRPAGIGPSALVELLQAAGEVVISVSDRGIGLSHAQIGRLFQPFTRLDQHLDVQGVGLGLYICKAIAEAHGGRIWVVSELGQGSTFSVALPQENQQAMGK